MRVPSYFAFQLQRLSNTRKLTVAFLSKRLMHFLPIDYIVFFLPIVCMDFLSPIDCVA